MHISSVCVLLAVSSTATSYHKEILDTILGGNFTSIMRPVVDDAQTTQVSMRLTLYQIRDMVSDIFTSHKSVSFDHLAKFSHSQLQWLFKVNVH